MSYETINDIKEFYKFEDGQKMLYEIYEIK